MVRAAALCLVIVSLAAFAGSAPQQAGSAEALMGAAQHLQDVEGDYGQAIATYRKVLAVPGVGRELAARAQFSIGVCYERLGSAEARAAYETVVRLYPDQKDVVEEARARLAALARASERASVATLTRVPLTVKVDSAGPPSPDGRFIALRDVPGNVVIQDLRTGKARTLTKANPATLEMNDSRLLFAPDGNRVAYVWQRGWREDGSWHFVYELHVYDLKSSTDRLLRSADRLDVACWMPDGQSILFFDYPARALSTVAVRDGAVKPVKSLDGLRGTLGNLRVSPDGRFLAYDFAPSDAATSHVVVLRLGGSDEVLIVSGEDTKAVCGWSPDGRTLFWTSDRSGTVDLFRVSMTDGRPEGAPVVVHRDLGKMTPLGITRDGTLFFSRARNLSDVYVADFDVASAQLRSEPVRADPSNTGRTSKPAWSPDGRLLGYYCGNLPVADGGPSWLDSLCVKSLETGNVRKLKLEGSLGAGLGFAWCCSTGGNLEIRGRGYNKDKKLAWLRLDADSGRLLGEAASSGRAIRYPFDRNTRITRVFAKDGERETEIYEGREGERARVLDTSDGWKLVALDLWSELDASSTRLVVAAMDGSEQKELLELSAPARLSSATFSPGNHYLICVIRTGDPDLDDVWVVPLDGTPRRRLQRFPPSTISDIALDAAGSRIAFVGFQTARPEIWTLEHIGPQAGQSKKQRP